MKEVYRRNIPNSLAVAAKLKDYLIKVELESINNIKLLKLLKARELNPEFDFTISDIICGIDDESYIYPYRKGPELTQFFNNLGFPFIHDGSTRKYWVRDHIHQLDIKQIGKVIRKGIFDRRFYRKFYKTEDISTERFRSAVHNFQKFIDNSIADSIDVDLGVLVGLNVNVDLLFNPITETADPDLNLLIDEAKDRYLIEKDRQIALEKIWDAFERLKTYFDNNKRKSSEELVKRVSNPILEEVIELEFRQLTKIGNEYRIRHHEKDKIQITKKAHQDYLFFRMLTLIDLSIRQITIANTELSDD